jgi:hypothetical protein
MSKEKARRRAEERARRSAPHPRTGHPATNPGKKKSPPKRSTRQQRQRNRVILVAVCWVLANAAIWVFTDTWTARWLGLTLTTIAVPLIVWLVWDPEGRTGL